MTELLPVLALQLQTPKQPTAKSHFYSEDEGF